MCLYRVDFVGRMNRLLICIIIYSGVVLYVGRLVMIDGFFLFPLHYYSGNRYYILFSGFVSNECIRKG